MNYFIAKIARPLITTLAAAALVASLVAAPVLSTQAAGRTHDTLKPDLNEFSEQYNEYYALGDDRTKAEDFSCSTDNPNADQYRRPMFTDDLDHAQHQIDYTNLRSTVRGRGGLFSPIDSWFSDEAQTPGVTTREQALTFVAAALTKSAQDGKNFSVADFFQDLPSTTTPAGDEQFTYLYYNTDGALDSTGTYKNTNVENQKMINDAKAAGFDVTTDGTQYPIFPSSVGTGFSHNKTDAGYQQYTYQQIQTMLGFKYFGTDEQGWVYYETSVGEYRRNENDPVKRNYLNSLPANTSLYLRYVPDSKTRGLVDETGTLRAAGFWEKFTVTETNHYKVQYRWTPTAEVSHYAYRGWTAGVWREREHYGYCVTVPPTPNAEEDCHCDVNEPFQLQAEVFYDKNTDTISAEDLWIYENDGKGRFGELYKVLDLDEQWPLTSLEGSYNNTIPHRTLTENDLNHDLTVTEEEVAGNENPNQQYLFENVPWDDEHTANIVFRAYNLVLVDADPILGHDIQENEAEEYSISCHLEITLMSIPVTPEDPSDPEIPDTPGGPHNPPAGPTPGPTGDTSSSQLLAAADLAVAAPLAVTGVNVIIFVVVCLVILGLGLWLAGKRKKSNEKEEKPAEPTFDTSV